MFIATPSSGWRRFTRAALSGLFAATMLSALIGQGGCVEDKRAVDRTSPYKIDKKMFEGVWMYTQTTIEVPFSSAVSFIGESSASGKKLIFDIQENWLIAYPVTETIEGSEADWRTNSIRKYWDPDHRDEFQEMYVGPPVARWPITSHFDLVRNYNTFNGAQSNELTENTVDRPWYQRDYFRVDWHRQGIVDFFFSLKGNNDAYFVGEEKPFSPDEFHIDDNGGYFDFVIRSLAWAAGQNRCNIYDLSQYDCARTEVKVRHAFRRYDHHRDFEPVRYHNDEQQDKFGFFLTERHYYDYDWGPSYKGMVSWANRWNLWDKTFDFEKPLDDAQAEVTTACFADRECNRADGYRCQKDDGWFVDGYCAKPVAKPFKERGLRPIIYHLSADWHADYRGAAFKSADAWDDVFKDAIAWLLLYEEKGVAAPKGCTKHADCANGDLVADETFTYLEGGIHCQLDRECGSGVCGADSFCGTARTCNSTRPCADGQTCSGGMCQSAAGAAVTVRTTSNQLRSSTLIYGGGERVMATHDYFPTTVRQAPALPAGQTWVRFANLAAAGGDFGLTINGATIAGGGSTEGMDLDPTDPAMASYVGTVPVGNGVSVVVTSGGTEVASTLADIQANQHYIVVYNGTDVVVAGETYNRTSGGVRGLNAGGDVGALDFGIEGAKLVSGVQYQAATPYLASAGSNQRATLSRAGGRGEFTCYQADTLGYCAGWAGDFTEADRQRVRDIKAELPAMFVLCENQYDEVAASVTLSPEERKTTYTDARYTRANGYNPCGDATRVPHPTELKRQGDIRYSFFYWVNEAQRSGPLGYGPSEADPETGEIIVANANIYGGSMHTYAQFAADLLALVSDDLALDDVITGEYIREYLKNVEPTERDATYRALQARQGTGSHDFNGHEHDVISAKKLAGYDADAVRAVDLGMKAPMRIMQDYEFPELVDFQRDPERLRTALDATLPHVSQKAMHDRLNKIRGTPLGEMMVTDEIRYAASQKIAQSDLTQAEAADLLAPTAWSTKYAMKAERERMKTFATSDCMFLGEFLDDALFGLAMEMKNKGLSPDEIRLEVGARILQGVLEHEIGHTVGLRHNFSGSTDVFNFFDPYYEIREKEVILCQSDSWCDQITGEICAISSCAADGDCLPGSLCGTAGQCTAPDATNPARSVPTGACGTPIDGVSCINNRQCGDGNVCYQNRCYAPREQFAPRGWLTDSEKANKRTQYQYTSIMDYGGRVNSDIESLGKYDYAAIKFGYAQLVDTYTDTTKLDKRVEDAARLTGSTPAQYSFYRNAIGWPTRGTGFFHPFNYITNYIGVEENLKRTPVPYHLVKNQRNMTENSVRQLLDMDYVEVPYAFCSDEFRGNMGCYYFDQGIDAGEMAASATEQMTNYYVYDAFKRERLFYGSYGNPMGYYARIMDRYLRVLGDVGMFYALYDSLLFRYSWYLDWKTQPLGGRAFQQAAQASFDTLRDIIASPAPGGHRLDPRTNSYVSSTYKFDQPGVDLEIPFGIGRYPATQFGSDLGYYYWEHPLFFGSFWEKLGALVTLTDSTAYFVDTYVGEQIDIGIGTSLGYNTVFADELTNFMGGIITGDLEFYAGKAINGRYVPPSISSGLPGIPVEPGINNFTMKLYAAAYGLAFIPAGFNPQFIDRLAVFLEGEARQYDTSPLADLQEVRFNDPIGGKVYVAYSTNYGRFGEPRLDVSVDLVMKAQDLADDWAEATDIVEKTHLLNEMMEVREVLDLLRQLHQVYGSSTLGL